MNKKKAYLVVGVIPKDTCAIVQRIKTELENKSDDYIYISEQDIINEYVKNNEFNSFCLKEWLEPIKNKIIVSLFEKTESANSNVIIEGSFALDADIKKIYIEILEEQDYEVTIVPVYSNIKSIIFYGLSSKISFKSLYLLWKKYNQQFTRTYTPLEGTPTAIVVNIDENEVEPTFIEIIQSLSDKNRIIVITKNKNAKFPFDVNHYMIGSDKIDVFWTKIAYHFNVKMVIDSNPIDILKWHQISVPVMSLINQSTLERNL